MDSGRFDDYIGMLRKGLRGLPRPDVDDIVAEIRSHVDDVLAEGGDMGPALQDLGPAESVAAEAIERRIRRSERTVVPEASAGRRFAAWLADVVVGWAPMVLNPAWIAVGLYVQVRFWMTEEMRAQVMATPGVPTIGFPTISLLVLAACLAWGLFYWIVLRRQRSASVGMRMAGLSRIATADGPLVLRTTDLAEGEAARIVARPKWYLAAPLVPILLLMVVFGFDAALMTVGSFFQPGNPMLPVSAAEAETEDAKAVVSAFYDAVLEGDAEKAARYVDGDSSLDVDAFVEGRAEDGIESWTFGPGVSSGDWYVVEQLTGGRERMALVTIGRQEEQEGPGDIVVTCRVLDCTLNPLGDSADSE